MERVNILVDYSNVIVSEDNLVPRITAFVERLSAVLNVGGDRQRIEYRVRLYDGWEEQIKERDENSSIVSIRSRISRNAQAVSVVLERDFPIATKGMLVTAELARSLFAMPSIVLPFTLRTKQEFYRLQLAAREDMCCEEAKQHHGYLMEMIKKRRCSYCKSKMPVMFTTEQKLVDTMIVSDMLFLATQHERVVIVSDDDDMLPGVLLLLSFGSAVYHIRMRTDQLSYGEYRTMLRNKVSAFKDRYKVIDMGVMGYE